uniref:retroviral-like aspartic protease family protein n=1 Tax=Sphingomonas sp. TaxID=28214 RepID=UPI0025D61725|nr:retroviral-like aspartic protease family protein [Sphingomonas sp.]
MPIAPALIAAFIAIPMPATAMPTAAMTAAAMPATSMPAAATLAGPAQQPIDTTTATAPPAPVLDFGEELDRMTLPVTISGAGPYQFIVDTGSQRSVISRELAHLLKLQPGRIVKMTTMTGTSSAATVIIPMISVGAFGGSRIEAPALEAANLGAPGLLGIDTLQDRALSIDFDQRRMTVMPATRRTRTERAGPDEIIVHAKSMFGQLVVTDAYYGDVRVRVILDTGSSVTMGNLALKKRVRHGKMQPVGLMSVTGGMLQADYTQISQVKLGGIGFDNLPIAFADAAPFAHFGLEKKPALLLGMDALRMFRRVYIDFPNHELRLALPRHF